MSPPAIDLVCWDFGDTLVDERFMRINPPGVEEWEHVYDRVLAERAEFEAAWMLGHASINDLIDPIAEALPMTRAEVSSHLRVVWSSIEWFPEVREWLVRLRASAPQAIVTVNPWEFEGIAVACGLVPLVDAIVTSAELDTLSKVAMARRARELLGLDGDLSTTILIDNRLDNVEAFVATGGLGYHFRRHRFAADADSVFGALL